MANFNPKPPTSTIGKFRQAMHYVDFTEDELAEILGIEVKFLVQARNLNKGIRYSYKVVKNGMNIVEECTYRKADIDLWLEKHPKFTSEKYYLQTAL